METLNILLGGLVLLTACGLAAMSAYEYGLRNGIARERGLADRRVQGVLAQMAKAPKLLNVPKRKRKKAVKA
jgi:hypothetical protein